MEVNLAALKFYIVDVFTQHRYQGNQLAVVLGQPDAKTMQRITREMNYSETVFLGPTHGVGSVPVRIFTPGREIPFAGHPTLGTAFVLRRFLGRSDTPLVLAEQVGPVSVSVEAHQGGERYWMTQPAPVFGDIHDPAAAASWLGLEADDVDARWPVQVVSTGLPAFIVPLTSVAAARRARLDMARYRPMLDAGHPSSVLVFASGAEQPGHAWHVRVFVGDLGIPEDPATGSANGCLAAYLAHHQVTGSHEVDTVVEQGVEMGRPSTLYLRARPTADGISVQVGGQVAAVAEGTLLSS